MALGFAHLLLGCISINWAHRYLHHMSLLNRRQVVDLSFTLRSDHSSSQPLWVPHPIQFMTYNVLDIIIAHIMVRRVQNKLSKVSVTLKLQRSTHYGRSTKSSDVSELEHRSRVMPFVIT